MSESDNRQEVEAPQPRQFTTDDGSTYQGVPAAEFPDYSDVDHADGDREVDELEGRA